MTKLMLEAKWTWAVDTAMHLGSGLSRAGFADRLIQRDAQGNPWLPNDAVKGALRMSAERVAAWLGASQEAFYHENEPYAPATRPMQLLFGETSGYSAGRLTDRTRTRSRVVSSTAIDAESGTARHDTLRNIEFLNSADLAFECAAQFELIPAAESSEFVETLLAATLAATDNVGAKAGNNVGAVRLTACKVIVGGSTIVKSLAELGEWLTPKRLKALRSALLTPATHVAMPVSTAAKLPDSIWHRLDITLLEPATFPVARDVSNQVATGVSIPATTLRGALWRAWQRHGAGAEDILAWLGENSRWSPAFPASDSDAFVPAPKSFVITKDGGEYIADTLKNEILPPMGNGIRTTVRPMQSAWIRLVAGEIERYRPPLMTGMHLARDYWSGSKRHGALYSRETLQPQGEFPTRFVAWVRLPRGVFPATPFECRFGKRRSVGGRSLVVATTIADNLPIFPASAHAKDQYVFLHLLTPAVVRDVHGHPLRGLTAPAVAGAITGSTVTVECAGHAGRTSYSRRGNWMSPWGHPRAPITAIDAGSVWRLGFQSVTEAAAVRARLSAQTQFGERQHEGAGWFAVDPPWIREKPAPAPIDAVARPPMPTITPRSWPGTEESQRWRLVRIAEALKVVGAKEAAVGYPALQQLAVWARSGTVDELHARRREMAMRPRPGRWSTLVDAKLLGGMLMMHLPRSAMDPSEVPLDIVELRFALEVLTARARGAQEN